MPIDASIPLQGIPPASIDISKIANLANLRQQMLASQQSIAASKAQQANTEAQLPEIQAQAQMEQFEAEKQKNIRAITMANSKLNEDGSVTFNAPKAIIDIAAAGYNDEAQNQFGNHYTNAAQKAAAETGETGAVKAKRDVANSLYDTTSKLATTMNQQKPGSGDEFFKNVITKMPQDMRNIVNGDPRFEIAGVTPESVSAGAKSQLQPGEQVAVDANDPKSAVSQQTRKALRDAGIEVGDDVSAAQARTIPGAGEIVAQNIIPNKGEVLTQINSDIGKNQVLNYAIKSGNTLKDNPAYSFSPTDRLSNLFGKYGNRPEFQAIEAGLQVYENDTGTKIPRDSLSYSGAIDLLNNHNRVVMNRLRTGQQKIKSPTYNKVETGTPEGAVAPNEKLPQVSQTPKDIAMPKSKAEYDKLPIGSKYIPPDGSGRILIKKK